MTKRDAYFKKLHLLARTLTAAEKIARKGSQITEADVVWIGNELDIIRQKLVKLNKEMRGDQA